MKIAIVHDDLVQWGGAERVLLGISETFPDAPIYTSLFDRSNKILSEKFKDKKIFTSFLQKIPEWKSLYKIFLPLYPLAFEQFDLSEYDIVISHTTRFAKCIITKPETIHISYCHTPPRFLWNFSGEKVNPLLLPLLSKLRLIDQISASRVDLFLAGSENARKRIKKIYRKDSKVLYPFVDFEDNLQLIKDGDFYLTISRLNKYKKIDVLIDAFNKNGLPLKIIGQGSEFNNLKNKANENIELLGSVSEELLKSYLATCKGLIVIAEEDFGLTPLEAQLFHKGVISLRKGGMLETVIENKTGIFFERQTTEDLNQAIEKFQSIKFKDEDFEENIKRFKKESFRKKLVSIIDTLRSSV